MHMHGYITYMYIIYPYFFLAGSLNVFNIPQLVAGSLSIRKKKKIIIITKKVRNQIVMSVEWAKWPPFQQPIYFHRL